MQEDFTNLSGNLVRDSLGGIKYSIFHLLFEICSMYVAFNNKTQLRPIKHSLNPMIEEVSV